jgi:Leucine-rich repeat (LRR) protein
MIIKILILSVLTILHSINGQTLSCVYSNNSSYGYRCSLTLQNPNGLNNFTSINGTHLTGMTNSDVKYITRSSGTTTNIPSIICDKFTNLIRSELGSYGIKTIDEKAFKNCKKLQHLSLNNNKITKIDENAFVENLELLYITFNVNQLTEVPENLFKNQQKLTELRLCASPLPDLPKNIFSSLQKLTTLHLENNKLKDLQIEWFLPLVNVQKMQLEGNLIEELPRNVFMSMTKLNTLTIYNNNLTVIRSDSFRDVNNLKTIDFKNNKIDAIDEKFIDSTGVQTLKMNNNLCVNQSITDNTVPRNAMRLALQKCFKNFDDLLLGM